MSSDSHLASVYSLGRLIDIVDDAWAADTLEFDDLQAPPDMEPNTEDGPVGQSVVACATREEEERRSRHLDQDLDLGRLLGTAPLDADGEVGGGGDKPDDAASHGGQ